MINQRRKHSKIDKLPPTLKEAVEQMMQSDFTYSEIVDFLKDEGYDISIASVCRYAQTLNANLQSLKMAQENFRVIMEEIDRYPALDTTEGILRLLSHQVLEAIQKMDEAAWSEVAPEKLLKQSTALIRAASYKKNMDLRNKDILDAGFEQVKTMVFEAMAKEQPELYHKVAAFLNAQTAKEAE